MGFRFKTKVLLFTGCLALIFAAFIIKHLTSRNNFISYRDNNIANPETKPKSRGGEKETGKVKLNQISHKKIKEEIREKNLEELNVFLREIDESTKTGGICLLDTEEMLLRKGVDLLNSYSFLLEDLINIIKDKRKFDPIGYLLSEVLLAYFYQKSEDEMSFEDMNNLRNLQEIKNNMRENFNSPKKLTDALNLAQQLELTADEIDKIEIISKLRKNNFIYDKNIINFITNVFLNSKSNLIRATIIDNTLFLAYNLKDEDCIRNFIDAGLIVFKKHSVSNDIKVAIALQLQTYLLERRDVTDVTKDTWLYYNFVVEQVSKEKDERALKRLIPIIGHCYIPYSVTAQTVLKNVIAGNFSEDIKVVAIEQLIPRPIWENNQDENIVNYRKDIIQYFANSYGSLNSRKLRMTIVETINSLVGYNGISKTEVPWLEYMLNSESDPDIKKLIQNSISRLTK